MYQKKQNCSSMSHWQSVSEVKLPTILLKHRLGIQNAARPYHEAESRRQARITTAASAWPSVILRFAYPGPALSLWL